MERGVAEEGLAQAAVPLVITEQTVPRTRHGCWG